MIDAKKQKKSSRSLAVYILVIGIAISLAVGVFLVVGNIEISRMSAIQNGSSFSSEEIAEMTNQKVFGCAIKTEITQKAAAGSQSVKINLKLLGLIKLKSVRVNISDKEVILGGKPVAFYMQSKGLIVAKVAAVSGEQGQEKTCKDGALQAGDILIKIDGQEITTIDDVEVFLAGKAGQNVELTINRRGKQETVQANPVLDINDNKTKLGIWVKNDASGVGTLSYVRSDTLRFGALGHAASEQETGTVFETKGGKLSLCSIIGYEKAEKGKAGFLRGFSLHAKENTLGNIDKNTHTGLFGSLVNDGFLKNATQKFKVANRIFVKPGKAQIYACISGETPKSYDVVILKATKQSKKAVKGMVIKVTDPCLLNQTGGIVQGMSGSPIVQKGKFVGVVTHVFLNDATKGYGVYADFMIDN